MPMVTGLTGPGMSWGAASPPPAGAGNIREGVRSGLRPLAELRARGRMGRFSSWLRRLAAWAAAASMAACSPPEEEKLSLVATSQAIAGGSLAPNDDNVFLLEMT